MKNLKTKSEIEKIKNKTFEDCFPARPSFFPPKPKGLTEEENWKQLIELWGKDSKNK